MTHKGNQAIEVTETLRELLNKGTVGTQEEICFALHNKGYAVSQAKVSRLLHKIGAIKVTDENGNNIYRLPHDYRLAHELSNASLNKRLSDLIISISASETLIVVHTSPGAANVIARLLDHDRSSLNILGCIAGDDTIFIAPKSSKQIKKLLTDIKSLLNK